MCGVTGMTHRVDCDEVDLCIKNGKDDGARCSFWNPQQFGEWCGCLTAEKDFFFVYRFMESAL